VLVVVTGLAFTLCGPAPGATQPGQRGSESRPSPTTPRKGFITSVGMKMVYIKPGTFVMGSKLPAHEVARKAGYEADQAKHFKNERPLHHVKITRGFFMSAHEVTQEQYVKVIGANPSKKRRGGAHPVETVSWFDAVKFCKKLSAKEGRRYHLPTEAAWEYACRAGTTTPFHFGMTISTAQANYNGNHTYGKGHRGVYRNSTVPVGRFEPNAWGLYDMHGNVYEWCQDWYAEYYYARSPTADPQGPNSGSSRVVRGGCWLSGPALCRAAARDHLVPDFRYFLIGFRVVCEVSPAK
jgi:formylglycine-generating enzyme required for sulfatase activity